MKHYSNENMLRQEKGLDPQVAQKILTEAQYGFLSMVESRDENNLGGYGLPLNFVWDGEECIYFHCAMQGHKIDSLATHPLVSFCVVGSSEVVVEEFTTDYQCVILRGCIEQGLSEEQRTEALTLLTQKYTPQLQEVGAELIKKYIKRTEVLRLRVESISGRFHSAK